jgi:hypothetical protein
VPQTVGLTRSREEQLLVAFFEYEYEYRPPGRTEYEYEVWFLGLLFFVFLCSCSCSNFAHSVPGSPGGSLRSSGFPARAHW